MILFNRKCKHDWINFPTDYSSRFETIGGVRYHYLHDIHRRECEKCGVIQHCTTPGLVYGARRDWEEVAPLPEARIRK